LEALYRLITKSAAATNPATSPVPRQDASQLTNDFCARWWQPSEMPALRHRAAHFALKRLGLFNRRYKETAFGREFIVPIINGRKTYVSEHWMADMIRRLFDLAPGAFIDVGVNLGQTLLKVAAIDASRRYIGFEPNPACADYSAELIRANGLPYTLIPAGLGSKGGIAQLQFYRDEDTDPSASLVDGFRDNHIAARAVVVLSLDQLPDDLIPEEVAIVKIDVEGGEADVLEGIKPLLREHRPFVLVEILPAYTSDNLPRIERQQQIERTLSDLGYKMFRIRRDASEQFSTIEAIATIGIHGDLALSDYLMAPKERVPALAALQSEAVAP